MRDVYLAPCPFCGADLVARWSRFNPSAKCATEGCKGGKLPTLNLDDPEDIAAWNLRAAPTAPAGDAEDLAFSRGVCVALQVVTSMDQAVLWGEIVRACDAEKLVHFAADVEPEEWELAGFAKYGLDELTRDKPAAAAPTNPPAEGSNS